MLFSKVFHTKHTKGGQRRDGFKSMPLISRVGKHKQALSCLETRSLEVTVQWVHSWGSPALCLALFSGMANEPRTNSRSFAVLTAHGAQRLRHIKRWFQGSLLHLLSHMAKWWNGFQNLTPKEPRPVSQIPQLESPWVFIARQTHQEGVPSGSARPAVPSPPSAPAS